MNRPRGAPLEDLAARRALGVVAPSAPRPQGSDATRHAHAEPRPRADAHAPARRRLEAPRVRRVRFPLAAAIDGYLEARRVRGRRRDRRRLLVELRQLTGPFEIGLRAARADAAGARRGAPLRSRRGGLRRRGAARDRARRARRRARGPLAWALGFFGVALAVEVVACAAPAGREQVRRGSSAPSSQRSAARMREEGARGAGRRAAGMGSSARAR